MENFTHKDIFDYSWRHFALLADQRLKTFNFYIILLAASVGASLAAFEKGPEPFVFIILGIFCISIAIAFLLIDLRSRKLLDIPKQVLSKMEKGDHWPGEYRLFSKDSLPNAPLLSKVISYSFAFRSTFVAHIIFGLAIGLFAFCPHADAPNKKTSKAEQGAAANP